MVSPEMVSIGAKLGNIEMVKGGVTTYADMYYFEDWVAETVENIFCRLTQRLENAFCYVKEHEEVQAGSSRRLVEDTMTVHSKNAIHMAEEVIKLNAGQVHLG